MTVTVQTQPEPDHIARAADVLEAVLLNEELDFGERLALSAALLTLIDVYPPYDCGPAPTIPIDLATGVRLALHELGEATQAASTVEEAIRVGFAARELRPLREMLSLDHRAQSALAPEHLQRPSPVHSPRPTRQSGDQQ